MLLTKTKYGLFLIYLGQELSFFCVIGSVQRSRSTRFRIRKPKRWSGLPPLTCVAVGRPLTLSELVSLPVEQRWHTLCLLSELTKDNIVKWLEGNSKAKVGKPRPLGQIWFS